jgi:hypothetical protein
MKIISNYVNLGPDDAKARSLILESLGVCAYDHLLSRKILERATAATGPMTAIFGSGIDLDLLSSYDCCWPVPDDSEFQYDGATLEHTTERLVRFIAEYLTSTADAVVVCENWLAQRATIADIGSPPPRIACFGDGEVYHLLTPDITDLDAIEDTIVARGRYQTGICSTSRSVPEGDIPDEGFLDEVVRNARHIFVPAFDGSGYLIWSLA